MVSFLFGQAYTNSDNIRKIRLENLKKNYKGKTVSFKSNNAKIVQGVLLDITNTDFVLSINSSPSFYDHNNIDFIFLPPTNKDLFVATGVAILGGCAGYIATIIYQPNPDNGTIQAVSTLSTILGFIIGKKAFYKPLKIDISGRLNE
tara:strand:- start:130 stop:570 length:441 start_codon:yes stop_codon:yes gene_type:complete